MKNPIIVALDVDDPDVAQKLFKDLAPHVGGFKIGPRLTFRVERSFLKDLSQSGILFIDHKFFDIPSTTVASVQVASELGAHWVTVHALNGPVCLNEVAELEKTIKRSKPDFRVLAVTVLTSFSPTTLPPIWNTTSIAESVDQLAKSAREQGLNSFVCAPEEIISLRKKFEGCFLVVPGIRPQGSESHDQTRTATPRDALRAGASALVVGRPITGEKKPLDATLRLLEALQ